ncbi:MAG: hypothetical protein AAFX99_05910, partial [Myxococcota bacterium]
MQRFHSLTLLLLVSLAAFWIGCGDVDEEEEGTANVSNNTTGSTSNSTTPEPLPSTLELIYISGHFGSYWDCPEEAYDPDGAAPLPSGDALVVDGDCAEPCTGLLNCESAQVSVRLSNTGDSDLTHITLLDLLIVDADQMERASLPVLTITTFDGELFDGTLAAGAQVDLRIDFRGPINLAELMADEQGGVSEEDSGARLAGPGSGAALRLIFKANDLSPVQLDTPEIYE